MKILYGNFYRKNLRQKSKKKDVYSNLNTEMLINRALQILKLVALRINA